MSWITIVWSMALAVCATLALIHLAIWAQRRSQVAHLLFALTALGAVGNGLAELGMMKATTVEAYVIWLRISLVPTALLVISFAWYIRKYFGAGRLSLAAAVTVFWTVLLIVDGFSPFSPIFSEIFGLRIVQTPWGEPFALANGVISPLKAVNDVANVSFLLFIMDASVTLWRRGQRRRALLGGGVMVCAVVAAILLAYMTDTGILRIPYLVTFIYVGTVILVGYPLIGDVLRAAQLTRELRASDASLRDSEARINLAANAANFGLWVWNIRDDELLVTEKWRRLFGFAESEPVKFGQLLKVVHPEDRERMKQTVQEMLEHGGGGEHESEYRITRPDGSTRWIAGYGGVELDECGKPAFVRGVSRDITGRKLAEEKFQLVLDAAPNAMIMVDSAGVITFANASATTVFGYSLSELIGRHIETLIPERFRDRHVGDRKGFLSEPSSRAMGAGRDLFGRRKDGSEFPVEVGLNPIRTAEGLFVLASVIDITARKQAELENQLRNMELARVGRVAVMGELAASLAHEVNNPIGAIVANARAAQRSIAAGKIGTEELTELLTDIVADGRRAGEVIQGIRNMVRKGKPRRALIQIGDTIRELLRIVHADAIGREIEVTAEVDSDTGQVSGDPVQILQVLLNLAINSFEAMTGVPSDARRLAIHAGCDGNGDILISMRDSGPGFPSGMVEQLFEPFFSTKAEGTGMGLAIARSIINAHGGTLSGENCDDGGACFTVHLPRSKEENSQAA